MNDSITQEFEKIEMPCPPKCPMALDDMEIMEWEGMAPPQGMDEQMRERMGPGSERRMMRMEGHGPTLNDMLGNIPMYRVVSYSIKDRKGGKRITIDLNDAPMFGRQEKIIIMREPPPPSPPQQQPKK